MAQRLFSPTTLLSEQFRFTVKTISLLTNRYVSPAQKRLSTFSRVSDVYVEASSRHAPPLYHAQPSDIDVSFPAGAGDSDLLSALLRVLPSELEQHRPDLVLYGEG